MKNLKYLKIYEDYIQDNEYNIEIPKTEIDGIFYHGTNLVDGNFIDELNFGYSDYNALWFTKDEHIADQFADNSYFNDDYDAIKTLYEVEIESNNIADISYELYKEIIEFYGLFDLRESIPILKQEGFDGWVTLGSIGQNIYDDYAIFNEDIINIKKCKLFIDNKWTDYMSLENAEKMYKEYYDNRKI